MSVHTERKVLRPIKTCFLYVQCGSVVTSMLEEEQAESTNHEDTSIVEEFRCEEARIHKVDCHVKQTVAIGEVEDSVSDESASENDESCDDESDNFESGDPVIEKTTIGTGMNEMENSSDTQ